MNKRDLKKWREDYTVWESPCLGEGLYLHVHFDEKDDVKRLGARWNPDPSGKGGHWWMPKAKLDTTCPVECELMGEGWSGTIEDWLNNHKMIAGQYGTLKGAACENWCGRGSEHQVYQLLTPEGNIATMTVYPELDIVEIEGPQQSGETNWLNMRDSRKVWDMMIQGGARKVIRQEETA